jgi:hypothetical protein
MNLHYFSAARTNDQIIAIRQRQKIRQQKAEIRQYFLEAFTFRKCSIRITVADMIIVLYDLFNNDKNEFQEGEYLGNPWISISYNNSEVVGHKCCASLFFLFEQDMYGSLLITGNMMITEAKCLGKGNRLKIEEFELHPNRIPKYDKGESFPEFLYDARNWGLPHFYAKGMSQVTLIAQPDNREYGVQNLLFEIEVEDLLK